MAWLDEQLSRDLKRLSEAVGNEGLLERVARRKARRRMARRMRAAGLGGLVLAASVGGGFGLLRAFQGDPGPRPGATTEPVPGPSISPSVGPTPTPTPTPSPAPSPADPPPSGQPEGLIAVEVYRRSGPALGLHLINSDGSDPWMVPLGSVQEYLAPAWAPDGERLAVHGLTYANNKWDMALYSIAHDGTDVRRLHTIDQRIPIAVLDLEWSPDGSRIAWVEFDFSDRAPEAEAAGALWVMNADGSDAEPITAPGVYVYDFSWAPDGQTIVYTRQSLPSGHRFSYDLFTISVDGSGITQLTEHGQARGAAWSPDGTRIAFMANEGTDFLQPDLYTMQADGSGITRITELPGAEDRPEWSPDGTRILFSLECGLHTVDVSTGEVQRLDTPAGLCLSSHAWQP